MRQRQANELRNALGTCRGAFTATIIFSLFVNLLMFVAPLYMLQIYDRVLASRSESTLIMLTVIAGGMLLVFGLLEAVRSRVLVRIGVRLDQQLNSRVFSAVFRQNVGSSQSSGSQSLRDLDNIREFMTGSGLIAFCDAPWVPVFIAVIFLFHPWLGFLALAGAIIIFILALSNEILTRKPLSEASTASVKANQFVSTSLRNAEAVEAMGMLGGIMRRWDQRHGAVMRRQAMASDRAGLIMASSKFVRMSLQVGILGLGAYLAIHQQITPGTMIAASIIMGRALAPVEMAVGQWRNFIQTRSAYARLNQLLQQVPERGATMQLPEPRGDVTLERVVAAPPGSRTAILKGVSFNLAAGTTLGVIGPSAAGKSTLARILVGVWPPASGSVRLDGAELSSWDKGELGPYIGYLPQDVELFDGTVAENIARFNDVDADKVVHAAKHAGAHEMVLHLPDGYDTPIGASGQSLSGGQRQRVALARALYDKAKLIVLDEPDANLDSEGEKALVAAMEYCKSQGATVIVITHRPALLNTADQVLVLDQGQVKMMGSRDDIISRYARPSVVAKEAGQGKGGDGVTQIQKPSS